MADGKIEEAGQTGSYGLRDLLCEQLRDLYDASGRFRTEIEELLDAAISPDLVTLLKELWSEYLEFSTEITMACEQLGVPPEGVTCEAMKGLVRECKDSTRGWDESATRDAAIIANAQRVSHYSIAGFGTAAAYAHILRLKDLESVFRRLLKLAVASDGKLSRLALGTWFSPGINHEAAELS